MRTPRRVKQSMFYSTIHQAEPIYARDEDGNIIYQTMPDGERMPKKIGDYPEGYNEPVAFKNSITGNLTEDELKAYGADARKIAKMTYKKGEFPFMVGTLIWKESAVQYNDDGTIDESSADYRIMGIQTTGRHFFKAILETVV